MFLFVKRHNTLKLSPVQDQMYVKSRRIQPQAVKECFLFFFPLQMEGSSHPQSSAWIPSSLLSISASSFYSFESHLGLFIVSGGTVCQAPVRLAYFFFHPHIGMLLAFWKKWNQHRAIDVKGSLMTSIQSPPIFLAILTKLQVSSILSLSCWPHESEMVVVSTLSEWVGESACTQPGQPPLNSSHNTYYTVWLYK